MTVTVLHALTTNGSADSDPPPGIVGFTVSVKNERKQPTLQRLGNQSVNAH